MSVLSVAPRRAQETSMAMVRLQVSDGVRAYIMASAGNSQGPGEGWCGVFTDGALTTAEVKHSAGERVNASGKRSWDLPRRPTEVQPIMCGFRWPDGWGCQRWRLSRVGGVLQFAAHGSLIAWMRSGARRAAGLAAGVLPRRELRWPARWPERCGN